LFWNTWYGLMRRRLASLRRKLCSARSSVLLVGLARAAWRGPRDPQRGVLLALRHQQAIAQQAVDGVQDGALGQRLERAEEGVLAHALAQHRTRTAAAQRLRRVALANGLRERIHERDDGLHRRTVERDGRVFVALVLLGLARALHLLVCLVA
jgi:hypothetical protein